MEEKKIKHLEMIEGIIERMGSNSFQLKGWAVTLVSVFGAITIQITDIRLMLIALVPMLAFWSMDAFYLQTERKYRILYRNVANLKEEEIDFNMDTRHIVCEGEDVKRICYFSCLFSKTVFPIYLTVSVLVVVLVYIVNTQIAA